jgi:hypothetical protein
MEWMIAIGVAITMMWMIWVSLAISDICKHLIELSGLLRDMSKALRNQWLER